jgi:hypothetical protein
MSQFSCIRNRLLSCLPWICFYCGEPATDVEHVKPRSLVGERTIKVKSCRECNLFASNLLFETMDEKRDYIHTRIKKKYNRVLSSPDWEDSEINELGINLKTEVIKWKTLKATIKNRLAWATTLDVLIVIRVLERQDTGKDSAERFAELRRSIKSELTLCVSIEKEI